MNMVWFVASMKAARAVLTAVRYSSNISTAASITSQSRRRALRKRSTHSAAGRGESISWNKESPGAYSFMSLTCNFRAVKCYTSARLAFSVAELREPAWSPMSSGSVCRPVTPQTAIGRVSTTR